MISDTVSVAIISAGGTVSVAVTALILNFRLFASLERRIERVEDKIEVLTGKVAEMDTDMGRIKEHLGMK